MKKVLTLIGTISIVICNAQLYTPTGTVSAVTNGSTTNVGIGTSTPSDKLTVSGAHTNSTILLHSEGNGTDTGRADLMLWASEPVNTYSGVGISNNVRNYDAIATPNNMLRINSARGGSYIRLLDNSMNFNLMSNTGVKRQVMTILSTGNVGIGTNNPQGKLHVDFGGEPKSIVFREDSNTASNMNSMIRFTWYNDTADFGMVRSGSYPIEALAVRFNGAEAARFTPNGNFALKNKLEAKEVKVTTTPTADFVFSEDYNLPKLEEVEKFVTEKKHLPEIASAKEMEKEGVNVGEFQIKLLQKIEELTLYSIEQNKQLKSQNEKILELEKQVQELKSKK